MTRTGLRLRIEEKGGCYYITNPDNPRFAVGTATLDDLEAKIDEGLKHVEWMEKEHPGSNGMILL